MTSPATLVCTSIDYIKYISVLDVPWFEAPFLCDPIKHLNPEERKVVAGWLNHFYQQQIVPLPDSNPNLNPVLNDRIDFIRKHLAERIHNFTTDLGGIPKSPPNFSNTPLGMTQGLFAGMNYPIAPKEFFIKKLFVIPRPNAFLESSALLPRGSTNLRVGGNPVTPILPITKELLDDFSVNELNQRITFEETPAGIKVNLQLPSPGDGQDIRISQEYVKQKDGDKVLFKSYEIVEIPHLPVLEIWPNFRTPDWKAYYTYFNKAKQDTFYAEPFLSDGAPQSFKDMKITKTSAFPEKMICKYKSPGTPYYEEAGFLLIKAPPIEGPNSTKTWNVGIDFGTSSTTVYKHDPRDGDISEPVVFSKRLLQITDSRDQRTLIHDDFLSHQDETTPFFSLFQEHLKLKPLLDERIKPLLDGRIYFVDDYKLKKNVVSNLKWSPDPADRKRTQAYLEQICLQCAAEAAYSKVNRINWRFSYPIAFSATDKDQFETICKEITADSMTETGMQTDPVRFDSESIVHREILCW